MKQPLPHTDLPRLVATIPAALYECDTHGQITFANVAYSDITGYSHDALLGMRVWELMAPGHARDAIPAHFAWLVEQQPDPVPFVTENRNRDGTRLTVEIRWDYLRDASGQVTGFACALIDSSRQSRLQKTFLDIMAGTASTSGEAFLVTIAEQLARALNMQYLLIGRLRGDVREGSIDTLTVWARGVRVENFSYSLAGTPSAEVVDQQTCLFRTGVQAAFPEDKILADMQVNSYLGTPLSRVDGSPFGIVVALDERELTEAEGDHVRAVLEIFAARIAAEVERRESEANYRVLFEGMIDGFALHDIILDDAGHPCDYRFLAVNPAFEALTGMLAKVVVGSTVRELMPGIEAHWIERYGHVALTGEPCRFEHYAEDLEKHFEVVAFRPAPMRFACIFVDISDRINMERQLRESEERYRASFEGARDGINVLDVTGRLLDVNPQICRLTGYSREELLEKSLTDLYRGASSAASKARRARLAQGKDVEEFETVLLTRSGDEVPVEISVSVLHDCYGHDFVLQSNVRDISDRRRAEAREEQLQDKLSRAQRMESLGVLAGGVAHDLNNILGPIVTLPELVSEDLQSLGGDPKVHQTIARSLTLIQEAGVRAAQVVRDLVALSRRGRMQRTPMEGNDILALVTDSSWVSGVRDTHPGVLIETIPATSPVPVMADGPQLARAISNLVQNAAEAIVDEGRVSIAVSPVELTCDHAGYELIPAGRYARVEVADTGSGIPPEHLDRIFEPFFTLKETGQRAGSGLGLSVVHGIVKDHEGFIDVQTIPGEGTTFVLYIRLSEPGALGQLDATPASLNGTERILVVDDDEAQRFLVARSLGRLGYQVTGAADGTEAIALFRKRAGGAPPCDLVILDMIMESGCDGLDTYQAVLKLFPRQKVLMVSGHAETARSRAAQQLGADWLAKPYDVKTLARAVRHRLSRP